MPDTGGPSPKINLGQWIQVHFLTQKKIKEKDSRGYMQSGGKLY